MSAGRDTDGRSTVSVVVTAGDEEAHIAACLETAAWADEIVVVDSCSGDRTAEIAARYTDKIHRVPWRGYVGQKQFALEKATSHWVLFLDADERITSALREEIREELGRPEIPWAGFLVPRKVRYLSCWIEHGDWYPDLKLRLFRRGLGEVGGEEPHDRIVVQGPVKRLHGDLLHYTYDDLADQMRTIDRFSTIASQGMHRQGRTCSVACMLSRPLVRFVRFYVLRRGFLDGIPGLVAAVTVSYGVFLKYAKLRELQILDRHRAASSSESDRP